jgi:purine nucleosidase
MSVDLIIDTDPGADDVVALLLAMASPQEIHLRAITTVAGNVSLDKTSRNACIAREWAGREEVPVYAGAAAALQRSPIHAEHVHGVDGLPGVPLQLPRKGVEAEHAVDYLVRTLREVPAHSITLAMIGPQTNLALALQQAPDIVSGLKEVVVMGGAHFNGGNITPAAEFNLFADPHAAEVVLASGVRLTYVPLDVTHKVLTSEARLAALSALGNATGEWVRAILDSYVQQDILHYGLPGGPVHDACVVAYLLQPQLFSGRDVHLLVDSRPGPTFGLSLADWYGSLGNAANVHWLNEGDAQGFFDLLTERLARLK